MYYTNPYLSNMNNLYQEPMQLIKVTGYEGAKAYQMACNSTVALFDANEDIMYIKSTDGAGFPTIKSFTFTPIQPSQNLKDYVCWSDFEKFKEEMKEYGKQFISKSESAEE